MKIAKSLIFIAAWLLSFTCGIYLYGAIFMGNHMSNIDWLMNACGYTLSMLWLYFNSVKK